MDKINEQEVVKKAVNSLIEGFNVAEVYYLIREKYNVSLSDYKIRKWLNKLGLRADSLGNYFPKKKKEAGEGK